MITLNLRVTVRHLASKLVHWGLDSRDRCTAVPDAPPPTYDSHGSLVAAWKVTIEYDDVRDEIRVHRQQEAGAYTKARRETATYAPTEIEDALQDLERIARICSARRLF